MSLYLPECNAQMQGSAGAVWVDLPAGASYKPANRAFVTGLFVETPRGGYENNVTYNILSKAAGYTGGNDGYLRFNQAASTLSLFLKNAGTTYLNTSVTSIPSAKKLLVMVIVNPTNYHLVVCEPGGSPLVSTVAATSLFAANLSAVDVWARFGIGNAASMGHYGPIEEGFHLLGEFPESAGVPDSTLIQNIASGAQDLAALDAQLTGTVAKKWRYRMRQQDELSDAYGIAGSLTFVNTTVDKVVLSGGALRPVHLMPADTVALASQVEFGTVGDTATAFADINIEGGTYTGSPAAIQARLRKEDGTVHVNWTTIDPAPTGGTWAAGQLANVPYVAGWLTCDIRAVDGGGTQIGDIVSSRGWKGTGMNLVLESQSQGTFLQDTGNGRASTATARLQVIHNNSTGTAWRIKKINANNSNSRVARGVREFAEEINTLYPGMPISWSSVGVQGNSLSQWAAGGAFEALWGQLKTLHGTPQPFALYMLGHSNPTANYETVLGNVIAKCSSDYAAPIKTIHAGTARYAQSGTGASHTDSLNAREGARDRVANNPTTDWWAAHPQAVKCDSNDSGPHPMDADVGQGRHGALLAWGIMGWSRAVEDEPVTLTTATKISGGTVVRLGFGPVNQSSGVTGQSSLALAIGGSAAGEVLVAGQSALVLAIGVAATGEVLVTGASALPLSIGGAITGAVAVAGQSSLALAIGGSATGVLGSAVAGQSDIQLSIGGTATGAVLVAGQSTLPLSIGGTITGQVGGGAVSGQSTLALAITCAAEGTALIAGASLAALTLGGFATGLVGAGALSARRIATPAQSMNGGTLTPSISGGNISRG